MVGFIETWVIIAFLGFTLAVPLGPVNTEVIRQVLNKANSNKIAWFAAFLTGIGAMTGDFLVAFSALTLGGEILIGFFSIPLIRFLLFSLNILILGYLGFSTLIKKSHEIDQSKIKDNYKNNVIVNKLILLKQYFTGLSLVITSPWSYLWWVSAGTLILFGDFNTPDLFSRLIIVIMFLSGIFCWIVLFTTTLSFVGRLPNQRIFFLDNKTNSNYFTIIWCCYGLRSLGCFN